MRLAALVVCLLCLPVLSADAQTKRALLIGINNYVPDGAQIQIPKDAPALGRFAGGLTFESLKGPLNDVASIRQVLTSEKFGFHDDPQHLHTLLDQDATRANILAAMNRYLVDEPAAGDTVVFYIAGHGSLRKNSKSDKQVYDLDGTPTPLENTIVPADAYLGAEDILDRDIMRIFNRAAEKGVKLVAIFDTCHSGSMGRGAPTNVKPRDLPYDPRDLNLAPDKNPDGSPVISGPSRKQNPVLVLAAAQEDQSAGEYSDGDPPHGLFTLALLNTLKALPAGIPAEDLFQSLQVAMQITHDAANQQPALDTTPERKRLPLFGGAVEKGSLRATVMSVSGTSVVLDVGTLADIGPGSEFESSGKVRLRVTGPDMPQGVPSLDRSIAQIISPPPAMVQGAEVVELKKWVSTPKPPLFFYTGPANLPQTGIAAALDTLHLAHIRLVSDPSKDHWTHILFWDGTQWNLQPATSHATDKGLVLDAARPTPVALGPRLDAKTVSAKLPQGSILWFDPPMPATVVASLQLSDPNLGAQLTKDSSTATYVAAATVAGTAVSYAWYLKTGFDDDVQTPADFSAGCSPTTALPLRTDWVPNVAAAASKTSPAAKLTDSATKLAKLNQWLHLQSAAQGSGDFAYGLAVHPILNGETAADPLQQGGQVYDSDHYSLSLVGDPTADTSRRWIYVMDIDCQGNGSLLFPVDGPGGAYPTDSGRLPDIPLPNSAYHIQAPYGHETLLLLSLPDQLHNPEALNFEGVVRAGQRSGLNPLEDLLDSASTGTRSGGHDTPSDWGVTQFQYDTLLKSAAARP